MNRANRPRKARISGSSYDSRAMSRAGDGSTLSLDFTTGVLDSRLTFTRSTTGTFINSSGYVTSAAINAPRFDYDPTTLTPRGLLIEGSANNLLNWSESFATSGGTQNWQTPENANLGTLITSPRNATDAYPINETTTNGVHRLRTASIVGLSGVYSLSVWAKCVDPAIPRRLYINASSVLGAGALFDLTATSSSGNALSVTGTASNRAGTWVAYPNGWYRCTLVGTRAADGTMYLQINRSSSATAADDSFAGNTSNGIVMWGAQLETGSGASASSYIPTGASTGNRANDFAVISGSNFTPWFTGGTSGTFYADWYGGVRGVASNVRSVLATTDLTTRHLHMFQISAAGALRVADFNGSNSATTGNSLTSGARTKGAFSFAYPGSGTTSTVNVCLNGGTVASSSTMAFSVAPTFVSLGLSSTNGTTTSNADVILNNSIRSIKYWPTVLPNTTLQSLTI